MKTTAISTAETVQSAEQPAPMGHNGGPNLHEVEQKAPFHVIVVTSVPGKDVIVDSRVCDIYNFQSRKWLTNHQYWAMHQRHTVEIRPASETEVAEYTSNQAQLLSRRYSK